MAMAGGAADKLSNRYEHRWTALQVGLLLRGEASSIRLEPPGAEGEGIEFEIQFPDGLYCDQVKDYSTRWTLHRLAEVLRKVEGYLAAGKTVRLILSTDAAELEKMCYQARAADTFEEFEEIRTGPPGEFATVAANWPTADRETAWRYLRLIQVRHQPGESLRNEVALSYSFLVQDDPESVVAILRDFFDDHLHQVVTAPQVWAYLEKKQIKRRYLVGDTNTERALASTVDRLSLQVKDKQPSFGLALRPHTDRFIERLTDPDGPQILLCEGRAGMGKSTVACETVQKLQAGGWYTAAVRMNTVGANTLSAAGLGRAMELADSPAVILANVADGKPSLLLVDQLDAVSTYSGRMSEVYGAVAEVLEQLRHEPTVKVLLVARTIDIEEDSRLRELAANRDRVERIPLDELSDESVRTVLQEAGTDPSALDPETFRLLKVPLHLSVFSRLSSSARAGSYRTLQQLYDQFTRERRDAIEPKLRAQSWPEIITTLVQYLSDNESLTAPRLVLDNFDQTDVQLLESEGILASETRDHIGFFHESYFDYLFARTFMSGSKTLHDFLVSSGQALFRRAQTRQILEYTEALDRNRFSSTVRQLLGSEQIRPHIKDVVIAVLRQIAATAEDWGELDDLAWSSSPLAPKTRSLLGQPAWFDAADHNGRWEHWLADPATAADAFAPLLNVASERPQRVSALVAPYIGASAAWRDRLHQLALWVVNADLEGLVIELIQRGELDPLPGHVDDQDALLTNLQSLAQSHPENAARIMGAFLRRAAARASQDGHEDPFTARLLTNYPPSARDVIGQLSSSAPAVFVDEVLPFVLEFARTKAAGGGSGGRQRWARMYLGAYEIGSLLVRCLDEALRALAYAQPETVDEALQCLAAVDGPETNYIVSRLYTVVDRPDEAVQWLLADSCHRQSLWDEVTWSTRDMITSASSRCSAESLDRLLSSLLSFHPPWDTPGIHGHSRVGLTQYRLLSAVDPDRRTGHVRRRLGEWERKFGTGVLTPMPTSYVRGVESPISDEAAARMKNAHWLRALAIYADPERSTHLGTAGGADELAQTLGRQAEREPQRFASLALQMNSDSPLVYFAAVLRAVSPRLDADCLAALCTHIYRACGPGSITELCRAIETNLANTDQNIVGLLGEFSNDQTDNNGYTATSDLVAAGINTSRGQAAWVTGALLAHGDQNLQALTSIAENLARDTSPAVRACAARAVHALHRHQPQTALALADELLAQATAGLYAAYTVRDLLLLALQQDTDRFSHYLTQALTLQGDAGNSAGQAWAVLAIWEILTPDLPGAVRELSDAARNGAAQVFAQHPERSLKWLPGLFEDAESTVRNSAASAVRKIDQLQGDVQNRIVQSFVRSLAFSDNQRDLFIGLNRQTTPVPQAAIEACEYVVALDADSRLTGHYLIPVLLRLYRIVGVDRTRCLDVFDHLALIADLSSLDVIRR
ncbi:hypothetical protein ACL02U_31925 [Streptomyces sp. MS06]|uniref:hypothetical protein n=1 Tax=Streptomyces sp. MS06 TaxID=3385974 RepID=UPI0039A1B6D8